MSDGVTSNIRPGTDIAIIVTGFKNPIDTREVVGFTVTSLVRSNGKFYPIDHGTGSVQVSEYALINQGKV